MGMEEGLCVPFSEPRPSAPGAGQKGLAHHLNLCVCLLYHRCSLRGVAPLGDPHLMLNPSIPLPLACL